MMVTASLKPTGEYRTMRGMNATHRVFKLAVPLISVALLFVAIYQLPTYGDFTTDFYTAAKLVNPYEYHRFLNPPWVIMLLRPFALLPSHAAGALWVTLNICLIVYSVHLLRADRLGLLLTLLNPFMWFFVTLGQLDALVLFGFALGWHKRHKVLRPFDMLLMVIKPQVIGLAALFRLREYGRNDVLMLFGVGIASLLIWGAWPVAMVRNWGTGVYTPLSMDVWPWGIPVGLCLLWLAWKSRSKIPAPIATFFLVPYVGPGSIIVYLAIIFSTHRGTMLRLALWLFAWVYTLRLML